MCTCISVGPRQDNKCLVQCLNEESRLDNTTRTGLGFWSQPSCRVSPEELRHLRDLRSLYSELNAKPRFVCIHKAWRYCSAEVERIVITEEPRWFCRLAPEVRMKIQLQSTCS